MPEVQRFLDTLDRTRETRLGNDKESRGDSLRQYNGYRTEWTKYILANSEDME